MPSRRSADFAAGIGWRPCNCPAGTLPECPDRVRRKSGAFSLQNARDGPRGSAPARRVAAPPRAPARGLGRAARARRNCAVCGDPPCAGGRDGGLGALMSPLATLIVSNMRGPDRAGYRTRAKLTAIYPVSMIIADFALNLTMVSRGGDLHVGIATAQEAVARPALLAKYCRDALSSRERAATARSRQRRSLPVRTAPQRRGGPGRQRR